MSGRLPKGGLVVIARQDPADDDDARAAGLTGVKVLRLGLLETEPGPDAVRAARWLEQAEAGSAVAWTSKRAAEALVRSALPGLRDSLSRLSLFAVGAESAAPLRAAGFTVEVPLHAEGARELAGWMIRLRTERGMGRVALLRGDRALPTLRDALRRAAFSVDEFEVYRIRFASPDVAPVERALSSGSEVSITFFSPSGVEALERLLSDRARKALRERARAFAIGDTTRKSLLALGYRRAAEFDRCGWWNAAAPSKGIQSSSRKPG